MKYIDFNLADEEPTEPKKTRAESQLGNIKVYIA